jgi:hypothetical protein
VPKAPELLQKPSRRPSIHPQGARSRAARPPKVREMAKKKWIAGAIKNPGALTAQAARVGMTPTQFCSQPKSKLSPLAQRRCTLMRTLKKVRPK